ncbi:MAG TPA: hypothetical protein PLP88_10205 [Bacteroidales bacterium]|nr:hypothetical protein [Bacteroidales bacterium]
MNKIVTATTLIAVLALSMTNCKRIKNEKPGLGLKGTDKYYSDMSAKVGRNAAFIAMFDSTGVMMRENGLPVAGIVAIKELLNGKPDTSYILRWEPLFADSSGNLGYTYGTWNLTSPDSGQFLGEGTYTTIWKQNAHGDWKAVLDTGNDGLKEK